MNNILSYNNRLDYGRVLMPEDGWTTSWAIGTTYSLNLEVLMTVPLALFHGKYLSESTDLHNLKTDMLDALNKVRDKMFVFVHENNIDANCRFSELMSFLDSNIYNVPVDGENKNFHPKVWLVRYERKNEYTYRLVTMSRNVTTATDFDIAVKLDGSKVENRHKENDGLIYMMSALMEKTGNKQIIRQIEKELPCFKFTPPSPFCNAQFFPHTFDKYFSPFNKVKQISELMVISPFVDEKALAFLRGKMKQESDPPVLISREYEMDKVNPDELKKWKCYQWKSVFDVAADYEEQETENEQHTEISRAISLHAKIYILKCVVGKQQKEWNNWFVGSTNCTSAGFWGNVEALTHIYSNDSATDVKSVLDSMLDLITEYEIKDSVETDNANEDKKNLRSLLFNLSRLKFSTNLEKNSDSNFYSLELGVAEKEWNDFVNKYKDAKITIRMFADVNGSWELMKSNSCKIEQLYCQQLSPFIRVDAEYGTQKRHFLMNIPMDIPKERNELIMSRILNSPEKLMRYLMFCLDTNSDSEEQKIGSEYSGSKHYGGNDSYQWASDSLPIYERLLLAASRNKKALCEIDKYVQQLENAKDENGNNIVSEEFKTLWKLFKPYAK